MTMVGSSTTTYRIKLYCEHLDWLRETKCLYNKVEKFYHELLLDHPEFWELSCQMILRELEILTLVNRKKEVPKVISPFHKIPVYFRRAAINSAIALVHSYYAKLKNWEEEKRKYEEKGILFRKKKPEPTKQFHASPLFYKGMYKNFEETTILLKLYDGTNWNWIQCRVKGRVIPNDAEKMSPTIVIKKERVMLHVPVKTVVTDIRSVKERMASNENVCGISFTNTDYFAVCVVCTSDGKPIASKFIHGGKEYKHHGKKILDTIRKNRAVMGKHFDWTRANKKHWQHLNQLGEYWSHKVSKEIIEFCKEHNVKVISIIKMEETIKIDEKKQLILDNNKKDSSTIDVDKKNNNYKDRMKKITRKLGKYTALYLSFRIKEKLQYKAWKEGIVITGVRPHYTSNKCTICRSYLVKRPSYIKTYCCKEGHIGNRHLNTAKNIAKMSLKKFGKQVA